MSQTDRALMLNRSTALVARFADDAVPYQLIAANNAGFPADATCVVDWILVDITNGGTAGVFNYALNYRAGLALNPGTGLDYVNPAIYTFSYSLEADEADTIYLNFAPGGLPLYYKNTIGEGLIDASFMQPGGGAILASAIEAAATAPIGCTFRIHIGMHFEQRTWRSLPGVTEFGSSSPNVGRGAYR